MAGITLPEEKDLISLSFEEVYNLLLMIDEDDLKGLSKEEKEARKRIKETILKVREGINMIFPIELYFFGDYYRFPNNLVVRV